MSTVYRQRSDLSSIFWKNILENMSEGICEGLEREDEILTKMDPDAKKQHADQLNAAKGSDKSPANRGVLEVGL